MSRGWWGGGAPASAWKGKGAGGGPGGRRCARACGVRGMWGMAPGGRWTAVEAVAFQERGRTFWFAWSSEA